MEIQITDKYKAKVIPHNYQLIEWIEGGEEVRLPGKTETTITKSGWQAQQVFYANLPALVKHVARLEANKASDLEEWLNEFTVVINEFEERQNNVKEL